MDVKVRAVYEKPLPDCRVSFIVSFSVKPKMRLEIVKGITKA